MQPLQKVSWISVFFIIIISFHGESTSIYTHWGKRSDVNYTKEKDNDTFVFITFIFYLLMRTKRWAKVWLAVELHCHSWCVTHDVIQVKPALVTTLLVERGTWIPVIISWAWLSDSPRVTHHFLSLIKRPTLRLYEMIDYQCCQYKFYININLISPHLYCKLS